MSLSSLAFLMIVGVQTPEFLFSGVYLHLVGISKVRDYKRRSEKAAVMRMGTAVTCGP